MKIFSITTFLFSFCLLINAVSGQIVSTDINVILDNSPTKEEYDLDFNADGQVDFTLQFQNGNSGSSIYKAHVGSYNNNEVVCPGYLNVVVFNNGDNIGPTIGGWHNSTGNYDPWDFFNWPRLAYKFWMDGNNSQNGNFLNLNNRFIGVRFFLDGNTYYGYIEVSCIADPQPGYLEIVKMAYEATPNMQIEAGVEGCDTETYYLDGDNDGFGDPDIEMLACDQPAGYVLDNSDCDDSNNTIYPGAQELCNNVDDDCNGLIDDDAEMPWYEDGDNDGFGNPDVFVIACDPPTGYISDNSDCDDTNPFINPNEFELCNGLDENCNGIIDEDFPYSTWYADTDGDGFGDPNNSIDFCEQPEGYVEDNTDCDDTNNQIYPGAFEICNGLDDNCDGEIDEEVLVNWYQDQDGDGYGNVDSLLQSCDQPAGYVESGSDCEDEDASVYPEAVETCNGIDDNCDGQIDEGYSPQTWYKDMDNDGYGNSNITESACEQPMGYVSMGNDCDDDNDTINPGAEDICNGIDDNCDGVADENTPNQIWYKDKDEDGFGNSAVSLEDCEQPEGYVLSDADCDDNNSDINPDAQESCNGIDDNCDGEIDEEVEDQTFYFDGDGDGFGREDMTKDTCAQPLNYVMFFGDCDDDNIAVHPDTKEICNGIDDNCNGVADETSLTIDIFSENVSANGNSDGSAWVTVEGGEPPYSFLWNTNNEDSLITNLEVGDYSVTVTDDSNCMQMKTTAVDGPNCDSLEIFYTITDVLCSGYCNGTFTIESVDGGEEPFSYVWSDGFAESSRENLCPGNYSILITDVLDCQGEVQFEILEPEELIVELNPDSTYILFGGTPPIVESNYWYEDLFFFVEIEDSNGCIARDSILKTSTSEQNLLREISISPSITSDYVMVHYPESMDKNDLTISLFEIDGRFKKVFKNKNTLYVGDNAQGLYILKFDTAYGSFSKPFIIIK